MIIVDSNKQTLTLKNSNKVLNFSISTAKKGLGEKFNSFCTPRGLHKIKLKIGENCPKGAVFVSRRFSGEIYSDKLKIQYPDRDWILTRILWLSGLEANKNRYGVVDSMKRFIYIHGTNEEYLIGKKVSKGCIRMRNDDIMKLFDKVSIGDKLIIK